MAVDDRCNLQAFQQGNEQCQGTGVDDLIGACGTTPSEGHGNFSRNGKGTRREPKRCDRGASPIVPEKSRGLRIFRKQKRTPRVNSSCVKCLGAATTGYPIKAVKSGVRKMGLVHRPTTCLRFALPATRCDGRRRRET